MNQLELQSTTPNDKTNVRRRIASTMLYCVSIMIALGGLGDLILQEPFPAQVKFLTGDGEFPITPPARESFIHLIHALGGGLLGIGLCSFILVHFGIRRGYNWAFAAFLFAILPSEISNTFGMYQLGTSFYLITLSYVLIAIVGVAIALFPRNAFRHPKI